MPPPPTRWGSRRQDLMSEPPADRKGHHTGHHRPAAARQEFRRPHHLERVPVVGVHGGGRWYHTTPMWFPQMVSGDPFFYMGFEGIANEFAPSGKTTAAMLTCIESATCTELDHVWARHGPEPGLQVVYQSKGSPHAAGLHCLMLGGAQRQGLNPACELG